MVRLLSSVSERSGTRRYQHWTCIALELHPEGWKLSSRTCNTLILSFLLRVLLSPPAPLISSHSIATSPDDVSPATAAPVYDQPAGVSSMVIFSTIHALDSSLSLERARLEAISNSHLGSGAGADLLSHCLLEQLHKQQRQCARSHAPDASDEEGGALGVAILCRHFEVAKYLDNHGYRLGRVPRWVVPYHVVSGNLAMIKWLRAQKLAGDTTHWPCGAASCGHLEIVKWIHEHMSEDSCTTRAIDSPASGGHLEVVQ
ncbi:hypothetical protein PybrP1_000467 [[Pythium] brassicae (nom. inval.)]|nr:hypothetical protein PybrP1_000467 [[Pythium] brassicae (nom. inval.)]